MAVDPEAARIVFRSPNERIILDFNDGPVQAVYKHDVHGAWYVFAVPGGALREKLFCLRPLADPTVADRVADFQTIDEVDWLSRLGRETLLPACAAEGVMLRVQGREVLDATVMTPEELAAAVPRSAAELSRD